MTFQARFSAGRFAHFPSKVLGRLRSEIEAADLWDLHEIDPQALLSHEGDTIAPHASSCSSIHAICCASSRLILLPCSRCL